MASIVAGELMLFRTRLVCQGHSAHFCPMAKKSSFVEHDLHSMMVSVSTCFY